MQATLFFWIIVLLGGCIWILKAPWRRYHRVHIAPLEAKLKSVEDRLVEQEHARLEPLANAELFKRNFHKEVSQNQANKNAAYEEMRPLRDQKTELHREMDDVRTSLNRWHRGSKSFFGNKGRKIKDDSVLGWLGLEQTVAQKEDLERRRVSISSEILFTKNEISEIYEQKIAPTKLRLSKIFEDKETLKKLRRAGLTENHFLAEVAAIESDIALCRSKISHLNGVLEYTRGTYKWSRNLR